MIVHQKRDYQDAQLTKLAEWFANKNNAGRWPLLVAPTGSGKSFTIANIAESFRSQYPGHDPKILVLVPSKELAEQDGEKLAHILPDDTSIGYYSASLGKKETGCDVTVATIGSIYKKAADFMDVNVILIDECFVAGTKILTPKGSVPIEKIRPGDSVYNAAGIGVVSATSESVAEQVIEVVLSNGKKIRCTENHPLLTRSGWKKAGSLGISEIVIGVETVRSLWEEDDSLEDREKRTSRADLEQAEFLLCELRKEIQTDTTNKNGKEENQLAAEGDWSSAKSARRERARSDLSAAIIIERAGGRVDSGAICSNKSRTQKRGLPQPLQDRHSEPQGNDSNRGRWGQPLHDSEAGSGQEEGRSFAEIRVESVSRVKQEGGTTVYNLQVSGHPSYFANGIAAHNCHLVNPDDEGRYREFINTLSLVGNFIVIGLTATPFRGNGVWLTEGKAPLFGGIAHEVKIKELIDKGYLAPLVPPEKKITNTIDTSKVSVASTGDYVIGELDDALMPHLEAISEEVAHLAKDRSKIIAFTPSVKSAHALCAELRGQLFRCEVVCGETDKHLRATFIQQFREGKLDCLVTVLALAVGFDVPDIDCVVWCRPTQSPVLYIQGAGRGLRAAPGKTDCLWLDFSDTTERLGPIDAVTGRKKIKSSGQGAPYAICPECKSMVTPASLMECPYCGATLREPKVKTFTGASDAPVMASQITSKRHRVTEVNYYPHEKPGSPPSIRVVYMSGYMKVATEWICPLHKGYAGSYAGSWIKKRATTEGWAQAIMDNATTELQVIQGIISYARTNFRKPTTILVSKSGKYPDITGYDFSEHKEEECA